MRSRLRRSAVVLPLLVAAPLLAACGSSGTGNDDVAVSVVATTDVYGDIVKQVAGKLDGQGVGITSIIDDPAADPHSYEADARTQLAFTHADIVVENGGGYDDFADRMRKAANSKARLLNAYDIARTGQENEHVWYDFPAMKTLANRIAGALSAVDHAHASMFRGNAARFATQLSGLEAQERAIRATYRGQGVAITEPVPLYLLQASGLVNRTPAQFSAAVEEGDDVPTAVLQHTVGLFVRHQVRALVYNEQTSGSETQRILVAARSHNVPTVPVTETLPAGNDYLGWMKHNVTAVRSALATGASP